MIYRITLTHPIEGTVSVSVPEGWQDAVLGFERNMKYWSLNKFFKAQFSTYGQNLELNGQRDWLRDLEKNYGPDAEVITVIDGSDDDLDIEWINIFTGTLPIVLFNEVYDIESLEHSGQITFAEVSTWVKLMARIETAVDLRSALDLDGNVVTPTTTIDLPLPSQELRQKYRGYNKNNFQYFITDHSGYAGGEGIYGVVDFDGEELTEITQMFKYGVMPSFAGQQINTIPFEKFFLDFAGRCRIKLQVCIAEISRSSPPPEIFLDDVSGLLKLFIKIGTGEPVEVPSTVIEMDAAVIIPNAGVSGTFVNENINGASSYTKFLFEDTITLAKTDKIKFYLQKTTDDTARKFILFGKDGDGYLTQTYLDDVFEGYWDPGDETFPDTTFSIRRLWKISRDGIIHGISVQRDWVVMLINLSDVGSQDPDDWYVGPLAPTEGLYQIDESFLEVDLDSVVKSTNIDAFLLHDVADGITKRVCGLPLKSNYLGAPYTIRVYGSEGCAAPFACSKGLQIRGYSLIDKPNFKSLKDFWECYNPHFNMGMKVGKEVEEDVVIIERQEDFFDPSMSVLLSNVGKITKIHDTDQIFNLVNAGSEKGETEEASGIDDPQESSWSNVLKHIGKPFSIVSKAIVAGLAIEQAKRTSIIKSADYKYDNDNFLISVVESSGSFTPRLTEDIEAVSGMVGASTRFNKVLTPTKMFLRWLRYVSSCLQFNVPSDWSFAGGKGNYDLVTQATADASCPDTYGGNELSEKQLIAVSENPLFIPMVYTLTHHLTLSQFETIDNNREKAIGISQTDSDHKPFFIKSLDWTPETEVVVINAWPKEYFEIISQDDNESDREIIENPTDPSETDGTFDDSFDDSFD